MSSVQICNITLMSATSDVTQHGSPDRLFNTADMLYCAELASSVRDWKLLRKPCIWNKGSRRLRPDQVTIQHACNSSATNRLMDLDVAENLIQHCVCVCLHMSGLHYKYRTTFCT
jgi:hypothetical protein